MAECEKVCRYVDLPLQHASAVVLKRMRRPGNRRTYDKLLARIRAHGPRTSRCARRSSSASPARPRRNSPSSSGSSRDIEFDHVGVFTYSHEEGTRAFAVDRRRAGGDEAEAAERVDGACRRRSWRARRSGKIGSEVEVLIDGPSPEHELVLQGRLEGQAPDIDPLVILTDCDPSACHGRGDLIRRAIVGARGYDLHCRQLAVDAAWTMPDTCYIYGRHFEGNTREWA